MQTPAEMETPRRGETELQTDNRQTTRRDRTRATVCGNQPMKPTVSYGRGLGCPACLLQVTLEGSQTVGSSKPSGKSDDSPVRLCPDGSAAESVPNPGPVSN